MSIALALTAAGRSVRFGSNKLLFPYHGTTVGETCFSLYAQYDYIAKVVVLNPDSSELLPSAQKYGYDHIINETPEYGLSRSVTLALEHILEHCNPDGILFATADMPLIRPESISELLALFNAEPTVLCSLAHGSIWGKPVIFPRRFFPELMRVTGDHGGKQIIMQNLSCLKTVEVSAKELIDIDTPNEAQKWLVP